MANQKRCWQLTRAPGLTATEFARVRAFCWARQTPNIVNTNPVYQSPTLPGVARTETPCEVSANNQNKDFVLKKFICSQARNTEWHENLSSDSRVANTGGCYCQLSDEDEFDGGSGAEG